MLEESLCVLLLAHRKLSDSNILQIENLRKTGIRPPQILSMFANSYRGIKTLDLGSRTFIIILDDKEPNKFLMQVEPWSFWKKLGSADPYMFVRHTIDQEREITTSILVWWRKPIKLWDFWWCSRLWCHLSQKQL